MNPSFAIDGLRRGILGALVVGSLATPVHGQTITLQDQGTSPGEASGSSVIRVDFNHDGFPDLISGAPGSPDGTRTLYIYYGGLTVGPPADETLAEITTGPLGTIMSPAGDVNADGAPDFLAGSPQDAPMFGAAYVYFGGDPANRPLRYKKSVANEKYGTAVAGGADLNGDGIDDIAVSSPGTMTQPGSVIVYFGAPNFEPGSGTPLSVGVEGDGFGAACTILDWNGDGLGDLFVGAPQTGTIWGFLGSTDTPELTTVDVELSSPVGIGTILAPGGDLDGDGLVDLVAALPTDQANTGQVLVFRGRAVSPGMPIPADASFFGPAPNAGFGTAISAVGDLNLDGCDDLAVTIASSDPASMAPVSQVWIFAGSQNLLFQRQLTSLEGPPGTEFGYALFPGNVPQAVDFNADGYNDLFVGAPSLDLPTDNVGATYAFTFDLVQADCAAPDTVDLGSTTVNTSLQGTFALENNTSLILTGTISQESGCDAFSLPNGPAYGVPANGSLTVDVEFNPGDPGLQMCTLSLQKPCRTIVLRAIAEPAPVESCMVSVTALNFPLTLVGETASDTFTISNPGETMITGSVDSDCNDFVPSVQGYALEPAQSVDVRVDFTPSGPGSQACTLSLDLPCGNVALNGEGTTAPVESCFVSVSNLVFSPTTLGQTSSRTFTVENRGNLTFFGDVTPGCNDFTSPISSYSLDPGENLSIRVDFAPTQIGYQECTLDLDTPCGAVTLSGVGEPLVPDCEASPRSLDFGVVEVGQKAADFFVLENTGETTITGALTLTGCPDFFLTGTPSYDLAPGDTQHVAVTFEPQSAGVKNCTLNIDNVCGSVLFTGEGTDVPVVSCSLDPEILDFGIVETQPPYPSQTVVVTNTGTVPISGQALLSNCRGFAITGDAAYSLNPGERDSVRVTFAPPEEGDFDCDLQFDTPCGSVNVNGSGMIPDVILPITLNVPPLSLRVYHLWSPPFVPENTEHLGDIFSGALGAMGAFSWRGFSVAGETEDPLLQPGAAYWINTIRPVPSGLTVTGTPLRLSVQALAPGWNGVGNPTVNPVSVADFFVRQLSPNSIAVPLSQAIANGWIEPMLWTYRDDTPDLINNGDFIPSPPESLTLAPWSGFLLYAKQPLQLLLGSEPVLDAFGFPHPTGWTVELTGLDARGVSRSVRVGMSSTGAAVHAPPEPPGSIRSLSLGSEHLYQSWLEFQDDPAWTVNVSGAPVYASLHPSPDAPQHWVLSGTSVHALTPEEPVYLSPGVYRLQPGEPDALSGLLHVDAVRPNPVSQGRVDVTYTLNGAPGSEHVEFNVYNLRGRLVFSDQAAAGRAGQTRVWSWDMRDRSGDRVPAGVYWIRTRWAGAQETRRLVILP